MRSPQHPKPPHEILGVAANATVEEIKAAYKKQALRWHPDRSRDDKLTRTEHFIKVQGAYNALTSDRGVIQPEDTGLKGSNPEGHTPDNWERNMPHKISYPHIRPSAPISSSSSSSSTRTDDSWGSFSTAPSSTAPTSRDEAYSQKAWTPDAFSTIATKDGGSTDSLLEDWVSVDATNWRTNAMRDEKHMPSRYPTAKASSSPSHQHADVSTTHLHDYHHISTRGVGSSKVWRYSLTLTLEELFHGRDLRFRITRFYLSGAKENVLIDVHVPPGSQHGTIISCLNVGHQRRDGSFQDILFVVEEAPHETYARVGQDLIIRVQIPWTNVLRRKDGRIHFNGVDNRMLCARISYARERLLNGQYRIAGAGMPLRRDGRALGRGDVIVQWEIIQAPHTRWGSLKSWLRK